MHTHDKIHKNNAIPTDPGCFGVLGFPVNN